MGKGFFSMVGKVFDIFSTCFLGNSDKPFNSYLIHFYETGLEGDNDQKFEGFKELVATNEGLKEFLEDQGIELPCEASGMTGENGFFDKMDEGQAKGFYDVLKQIMDANQ